MTLPVSSLTERISGESVSAWEIHSRAMHDLSQGKDVIVLSVGDPEFDSPAAAIDSAIKALRAGDTHYSDVPGKPALRQAIATKHQQRTGQKSRAENVVVLAGAQSALFAVSMCLLERGDEVITFDPIYTTYEATLSMVGATIVSLPTLPEQKFRPDINSIKSAITPATRALFLANPSNPTGVVLSQEEVEAIAALAIQHDFWIVVDEVYADLVFEGGFTHFAGLTGMDDRLITVSSLSKSHAMTGWRLGWIVAPATLAVHVENLALCMLYGLPGFIQEAGITTITECDDTTTKIRLAYRERRDKVMHWLEGIPGTSLLKPEGGMFLMMDISKFGLETLEFVSQLYQKEGVSVMDAGAFGKCGDGFIRISFAPALDQLESGCKRIRRFLSSH
ncbi:MAG: octopine/nopaline transport system ATP-binding protein [Parasphingorhabdus sp.]|jgi:octopine/nopaline transport system ATP-binding protein